MALAAHRTVVSGTTPMPTLRSTRRQTASKLRSCTRSLSGRPAEAALPARKRCRALARSSPTKSWSSTSAKAMVARDHQHEAIAAERIGGQLAGVDRPRHDADVAYAFGDQPDDLVAQPFFQVDADMRVRRQERAQGLRQEFGQRIGVGEHP